ncbi:hypothetical protein M9458_005537, partial [Cirrhinus mrigala]
SRACRSPKLHRNPGHVSQSQLERPAGEERRAHRVSHFLGGIQQNKHSRHALPAQHDTGVPGHRSDRAHYLHHSGGRYDLQRSRSAVVLHHFLWCAA